MEILNEQQLRVAIKKYFNSVKNLYSCGNIETSYNRPILELVEAFGCKAIDFSGERSGKLGENIDLKLWALDDDINKTKPFAGIEVKNVGGIDPRARKNLSTEIEKFGNVILTDNSTWQFYHEGNKTMYNGFILIKKNDNNELVLDDDKIDLFIASIKDFILAKPTNIKSSNKLAYYMAEYAKTMRTIVFNILKGDNKKPMFNELFALYSRIKSELLPELNISDFADMYAQTIVYGLFIARYNDNSLNTFSRGEAIENLSKESHLLKQFFQHIATSNNLHPTLDDTINKLCRLFTITDLPQLLNQYEKKDTIVHFYEDFLSFYDLDKKKEFGAYYTPVQVVRYMVDMVDKILVQDFKINGGLANNDTISIKVKSNPYQVKKIWKDEKIIDVPKVAILDPACGTGTFGAEIIKFIKEKYFSGANEVFYKDWIQQKDGLLSRLVCFEIMMTSYVVTHLKIRRVIAETLGKQPDENLPTNIFLTNTLAEPKSILEKNEQLSLFDFSGAITDEAENADKWKARRPIKVIIGNPPYSAKSTNPYDISDYKFETDGITPFGEKKHLLSDDYVKFIRFAEKHINDDGSGILAYISNNGYLDNVTFRGMRASLLRTFDKIYILNLHGNSLKAEKSIDGTKDENIFDIRVGVSIIFAIKTTNKTDWAKVYYEELFGLRDDKFCKLEKKEFSFKELIVDRETALFVPTNITGITKYKQGIDINELFNIKSTGTDSGNDNIAIAPTKKELQRRIDIVKYAIDNEPIIKLFGRFGRGGTAEQIKKDVERNGKLLEIAYRPFDDKWTYYTGIGGWLSRTKFNTMKHFIKGEAENYGIVFTRGCSSQNSFSHVWVINKLTDIHFFADVAYIAPLYVTSDNLLTNNFINYNEHEFQKLTQNLTIKPQPQEIFDYCYGVLYDPDYREKYNEFLKRDYPRVPIIENENQFTKYSHFGRQLRELHLMKTDIKLDLTLEPSNTTNLNIEMIKFIDGKLFINKGTCIVGISQDVWEYVIGGYQVLDKWFKSHKGEIFDFEKFNHIQKVAGILKETIRLQNNINV